MEKGDLSFLYILLKIYLQKIHSSKKFCVFSNQAFLPVCGYRFSKQKTFKFTSHVTEIHM